MLIARPNGDKAVKRGIFDGPYMMRGMQYWSAKIEGRDGFSGSPIYNEKAELIGVFSSYDGPRKLAVISPGATDTALTVTVRSGLSLAATAFCNSLIALNAAGETLTWLRAGA